MAFAREHYNRAYFEALHPRRWFTNPPRKYEERNRDTLRVVAPRPDDVVIDLGCASGGVTFLLASRCREVVGVDASPIALEMAERERERRGLANVRWLLSDVADLSALPAASADAVAAIDVVEHVDNATLAAMLEGCRRVLRPGGRLGIYTPDRLHYVERFKARNLVLRQFPEHIAVRTTSDYLRFLSDASFTLSLQDWSVSPFPLVRWVEKALSPLPFIGPTFRYRVLLQATAPGPAFPTTRVTAFSGTTTSGAES